MEHLPKTDLQESGENYLETIYIMSLQGDVRSVDLASRMGFSKPSISRAVHLLESGGYLEIGKSGYLTLTPIGKQIAVAIYDRHITLTRYLVSLGVDETTAAEDACRMEHIISDVTFAKLKEHMTHCCALEGNVLDQALIKHHCRFAKGEASSTTQP